MTFNWFCIYTSSLAILFPIIIGWMRMSYLSLPMRTIFVAVIFTFDLEILSWTIPFLTGANHWTFNVFNVFEFGIISYFYYLLAERNRQWYLYLIIFLTLGFIVFFTLNLPILNKYNSLVNTLICLFLTFFGLRFFYWLVQQPRTDKISEYPYFWINVGVLLNFSGNLFISMYREFIYFGTRKSEALNNLVVIYYVLLFVFRICLGIGFGYAKNLEGINNNRN